MTIRTGIQYFLILVLMAGVVFALLQPHKAQEEQAVLGEAAPSFRISTMQGKTLELQDYKGQAVMINFWASWCTACVNELPLLNEAYKLTGVSMLAVNVGEEADKVQTFVDRYELSFPIGLDTDMRIKQKYNVVGLPLTIIIDKEGKLIERHEGELTDMADIMSYMVQMKND